MAEFYNIFISFRSHGGGQLAAELASAIDGQSSSFDGVRAFCSQVQGTIQIGSPFPEALKTAVEECELFVCLLSPGALDRRAEGDVDYVREEIKTAFEARRPFFVIRFKGFEENEDCRTVDYLKRLMLTQTAVGNYTHSEVNFRNLLETLSLHYDRLASDKRTRREYDAVLSTPHFNRWASRLCRTIYRDEIASNRDVEFVSLAGFDYDSIIYPCPPESPYSSYPFPGLCRNPYDLRKFDFVGHPIRLDQIIRNAKEEREALRGRRDDEDESRDYLRIISDTIFYPNRVGFMMDRVDFSKEESPVTAYYDIYWNNLKSSHYLEYELYRLYQSDPDRDGLPQTSKEHILSLLPSRSAIHAACADAGGPIFCGNGRCSNYGVQVMVVFPNPEGDMCTYLVERSLTVAAKPGFLQIIPSGGFEVIGNGTGDNYIEGNFKVSHALYRELLEECFALPEADSSEGAYGVYQHEKIQRLHELLQKKSARFVFLGMTMGLVGLRPELSFLLVIDDAEFSRGLVPNFECRRSIQLMPIREIVSDRFWQEKHRNQLTGETFRKGDILNTTSAGLIALARKHPLFQEIPGLS